jgi:enamine deaminase RidA (YjgF/YER057c/UK114 family)
MARIKTTPLQKLREKLLKEEHRKIHWRRYRMSVAERLKELGLELPAPAAPVGNYVPAVRSGNLVFLSGHGPVGKDRVVTGKLGVDLSVEEGYEAAKLVAIGLLGSLKDEIGDLDRVRRIVKLLGMVNCDPAFMEHPAVINGASDLLVEVFGEKGKHARSAVGMNALPFNIAVEIEMIVEVED